MLFIHVYNTPYSSIPYLIRIVLPINKTGKPDNLFIIALSLSQT